MFGICLSIHKKGFEILPDTCIALMDFENPKLVNL